jgi:hypothetical protein
MLPESSTTNTYCAVRAWAEDTSDCAAAFDAQNRQASRVALISNAEKSGLVADVSFERVRDTR